MLSVLSLQAGTMYPAMCSIAFYLLIDIIAMPRDALTVHLHVSLDLVHKMIWILDRYFFYAYSVLIAVDPSTVAQSHSVGRNDDCTSTSSHHSLYSQRRPEEDEEPCHKLPPECHMPCKCSTALP